MPHFMAIWIDQAWGGSENEAFSAAIRGRKEGLPDWWWVGRDFPMISRKSWTNHWELTVPDYRPLIEAENASFSGHFGRSGIGRGNDSENEASLAAIGGQKEGRPDWWWVGRDFPIISRKSRTDHCELRVPDYWDLIADANASFSGHFERSGIGAGGGLRK